MAGLFDDILAQSSQPAASPKSGMFDDLLNSPAQQQASEPQKQPFTLMDTWPMRLAKSLYSAATLPGDVYQGKATVPQSANMPGGENTENIDRVTALAGMAPTSAMGVASRAGPPSLSSLKSASTSAYDQAKNLPVEIKPSSLGDFNVGLQSALNEDGFNNVIAPKTFQTLDMLSKAPAGATVTPNNLRTIQRTLGVIKNSNDPTERMVAGNALDHFNNFLENLQPEDLAKGTPEDAAKFSSLVKDANGNYRAYKQAQAFDQRGNVANNNTHAANSGMNLENNLRTQVRQILNKPALQRGYDQDTLNAMQEFNDGSRTANATRMVGNLLGGGGGWGMLASGTIGHLMGLPPEALPAMGIAFKQMGNNRAASQFGKISEMIRANSPLAQQGATSQVPRSSLAVGAIKGTPLNLPQVNLPFSLQSIVPAAANNQQQ